MEAASSVDRAEEAEARGCDECELCKGSRKNISRALPVGAVYLPGCLRIITNWRIDEKTRRAFVERDCTYENCCACGAASPSFLRAWNRAGASLRQGLA